MRRRWHKAQKEGMERGTLHSWHSSRTRRRVTVGAGAAAAAMPWAGTVVSWNLAPSDTAMWWTIGLFLAYVVITIPVTAALNSATRGMTSLAEGDLDERQVADRLRAYTIAHRTMLMVLIVLVVVVLSVQGDRTTFVPIAAVVTGVVALFTTHMTLPVLVAGWRLPDPPPDDEDDLDFDAG
ncbi:hypothetical protein [Actinomadura algeriensis]|uniref:Type IV secretory pathway protease TraF n=1 Tax=Actinomadura algeriensis TaxID=1679523 RepID=A0ABR9JVL2_9ACTN|nr:hypothetical protein [Actinomadura algeriensis]MBE1534611.1 type IV secretory pathway protease TraF [Actinomadura algeriensis]